MPASKAMHPGEAIRALDEARKRRKAPAPTTGGSPKQNKRPSTDWPTQQKATKKQIRPTKGEFARKGLRQARGEARWPTPWQCSKITNVGKRLV